MVVPTLVTTMVYSLGSSIKDVTLFLTNFYPLLLVTLCHASQDLLKVRHTPRTPPPIFSSTKSQDKNPLYKNLSQWFAGFLFGCFVWKVLSGGLFFRSPFC